MKRALCLAALLVAASLAPARAADDSYTIATRNKDLFDFCAMLGTITHRNFTLLAETPRASVTLRVQGMSLDDVLATLHHSFDLAIVEMPGGYVIGPSAVMNRRFPNSRGGRFAPRTTVFALSNLKAADVKGYLEAALSPGSIVTADPRGLAVQVTGSPETIARAAELIAQLDVHSDQPAGGIATKAFRVAHAAAQDLYASARVALAVSPPNTLVVAPAANDLIATGTPEFVAQVGAIVREYDVPSPLLVLEVVAIDVEPDTFVRNLGVLFGGPDVQGNQAAGSGSTVTFFKGKGLSINAEIDALERRGKAQTLLAQTILCRNNQPCEGFVGDTISVVSTNSFSGLKTIERFQAGADLKLSSGPVIADTSVILPIEGTFSEISRYVEGIPQISQRTVRSNVELADNASFVLGTLYQAHDFENVQAVPGLGNLPLIGGLLRSRRIDRARSEVVFIGTVHIVRPGDATPGLLREPRDARLPLPPPARLGDLRPR